VLRLAVAAEPTVLSVQAGHHAEAAWPQWLFEWCAGALGGGADRETPGVTV
jgi:hypothetical protein